MYSMQIDKAIILANPHINFLFSYEQGNIGNKQLDASQPK